MMKPLCTAPFTSYSHKPEGYRPCCSRHAKAIPTEGGWWNGEYLTEFRKKMFSYETLPTECKKCIDEQGSGGEKYSHPIGLERYNQDTGVMSLPPKQVYLFTGNRCNLACVMCDSTFSDTHAKRFPERVIPVNGELKDPIELAKHHSPNQWVVYGGEPFLYDDIYDLMLLLLQKGGTISFLTNGMYSLKDKAFDLILKHPHRFTMTFSVDGDYELNQNIRLGCSTKRILANTKKFLEAGVYVDIHFTHSTLNSHGFVDFCKMLLDYGLYDYKYFSINTCAVEFPEHYSPKTLEHAEKVKIKNEVLSFKEDNPNLPKDIKQACDDIIGALQLRKIGDIL